MVFSSLLFLYAFLPLNLLFYVLARGIRMKNAVMLLFSLVFYAWGGVRLLPVLLVLPALCAFSYRLGQKHFVLKNALVYSKTKTPQGGGVK